MPAAHFAHVLDRLMGGGSGLPLTAVTAGILTSPLLSAPMSPGIPAWLLRGVAEPGIERPRRLLTPLQQEALAVLRCAGAYDLRPDYFSSELKSAFRRLARQLHPDRHPGVNAEARARLSAAFRDVRDAYRALPL